MRASTGTGTEGRTLRDRDLDAELQARGHVIVPLLDATEVEYLLSEYFRIVPDDDYGLTIDHLRHDRSVMKEFAELLAPVWERHLPGLLVGHRPVLATFVTKHPGPLSNMFLHDDRTYVDERIMRSHTVWIPLSDVGPDLDNGGLEVIPGSQLLATGLSGTNTADLTRPYGHVLDGLLERVTARAGDAVVYDTRMLHASPANMSVAPRVAVACAVAPVGAHLIQVVATGRRGRRVHQVDESFFLEHQPRDVESAIPSEYPVVEEYVDRSRLDPADVAQAFHLDHLPRPRPVIPPDVASARWGRTDAEWSSLDTTIEPCTADLAISAATLGATGSETGTARMAVELRVEAGGAAIRMIRYRWRDLGVLGAFGLSDRTPTMRAAPSAAMLVLDSGARAILVAHPDRFGRHELHVIECPQVGAGAWSDDRVTTVDLGWRAELIEHDTYHLWNDGPGPLVAIVTRTMTRPSRKRPPRE